MNDTSVQTESLRSSESQFYVHGIKALKPNHPEVANLIEEGYQPSDFGSRIWRSSYLLIEYLSRHILSGTRQAMELGCGWGLAGTYLQKTFDVEVIATDRDADVFPFQQLVCRHNDIDMQTQHCSLSGLREHDLRDIDLMIGADICYSDDNARDIERLCLHMTRQQGVELILADSGRAPFLNLVERLGLCYSVKMTPLTLELPTAVSGHILHAVISP